MTDDGTENDDGDKIVELTARQKALAAEQAREQERRLKAEAKARRPRMKKLRLAFVFSGLFVLAVVSWVFGVMMAVAQDLPDLESRAQFDAARNSVVMDRNGNQIATLTGNERRILLESEEISPLIKQAVVSIEDERFYEHEGVDYLGIARALREDIISRSAVQGGSTITQQFVKNALEAQQSRTVLQKLRESALAYQIERKWSKDKILTNYLNNIYFGEGAYGVEAAARTYFGANHPGCGEPESTPCASQLRVEEAAMLAAVISSPEAYSPRADPDLALERRNIVLAKMRELGRLDVTDEEFEELKAFSVPGKTQIEPPEAESDAPYFTDWLRQQVVDRYGAGAAFGGGLEIRSTIDMELQAAAEAAVESRTGGLGPTSAVVVLDSSNAEVLALVGGTDFENAPFNLATNGRRQPGSSFKPFTLVTALEQGRSPEEVLPSRPLEIPFTNKVKKKNGKVKEFKEIFEVNNYEDSYLGQASIRAATTFSDNSIYAQLGVDVGVNKVIETAREMGIQSKLSKNPAAILGGLKRGVTPLEMAYAYTTIANGGERVSGTLASRGPGKGPVALEKVLDRDGDELKDDFGLDGDNEKTSERVLQPDTAEQAQSILRTVVAQGTGKRAQVGDDFIWGKTGTTDNNVDAWFVGANEDVTVAVWVGYADTNTPMETEFGGSPVDGGTIPALIWNDVVTAYNSIYAEERAVREAEAAADGETTTTTTAPPVEEPSDQAPVEEEAEAPPAPATEESDGGGGNADQGTDTGAGDGGGGGDGGQSQGDDLGGGAAPEG